MNRLIFLFIFVGLVLSSTGQTIIETRYNPATFEIPDIPGFYTLKCDFHMHSVFSDGRVWPDIRVNEAIAEGIDVISITDHVEKHREGVEDNHVIGYQIAKARAAGTDVIVIPGGEISATKDHYNALFLQNQDDPALRDTIVPNRIAAANVQGGFVFWNHPGWTSKYKDGIMPDTEELIALLKNGEVKGIEVCNGDGYWVKAHQAVLDNNLTLIGNSDTHGISYYHLQPGKHRTITLVFAKERSSEGVQEALLTHRTAIYKGDDLIGSAQFLDPLFKESVKVNASYRRGTSVAYVELINDSDFDFYCDYLGDFSLYNALSMIKIPAHSTIALGVKTGELLDSFPMKLKVHNAITAPGEKLVVELPVKLEIQ